MGGTGVRWSSDPVASRKPFSFPLRSSRALVELPDRLAISSIVEPASDATLFDLAQFELDLEALLERPVDVISRRSLDPVRDRSLLSQAVEL
jgi:hypothetical protein